MSGPVEHPPNESGPEDDECAAIVSSKYQIFVPRLVDATNNNAQNLNAKALLSRFTDPRADWTALHYDAPDQQLAKSRRVHLQKLWRRHLWMPHLVLLYQQAASAIFYPGPSPYDRLGLEFRSVSARGVPLIATLEGLLGDAEREAQLSKRAGHKVFCQRVSAEICQRVDRTLRAADHVIAISPFLAQLGRRLYGDKFSVLPLGLDLSMFHSHARVALERPRVVSAGTVKWTKRPEIFVEAAAQNPSADFVWFGGGPELEQHRSLSATRGLNNLTFAGPKLPGELADELRRSSIFVMCSQAEGVPKAMQEAAACGLPIVAFSFYEPPTVIPGENGLLASSDEEFFADLRTLIESPSLAARMGQRSAAMAAEWDWNLLAPKWEGTILNAIEASARA